jgi:uncharacterized protein with ATP-grasp and redox domains
LTPEYGIIVNIDKYIIYIINDDGNIEKEIVEYCIDGFIQSNGFNEYISKNRILLHDSKTNMIQINEPFTELKYEVSNIKFIMLTIILKTNEEYNVDLKTPFNYYVVGNTLDCLFFKYYLKHVLNIKINDNVPFEYTINIIDNDANMKEINQNDIIKIKKDSYELLRLN